LHLFFWYFAVLRPLPGPKQSLILWDAIYLNNRGLYLPGLLIDAGQAVWWLAPVLSLLAIGIWKRRTRARTPAGSAGYAWAAGAVVCGFVIMAAYFAGTLGVRTDMPAFKTFNVSGGFRVISEFVALLLALSLYTAAFIGEIVRAGINAVPRGQMEAASAVGLRRLTALRLVIIPQALRLIVPPLTSQYLNLTKNSSLAVAIAYPDLVSVFAGTALNQTGQAVEILLITMAAYLCFSLITSIAMNWFNARNLLRGQSHV